MRNNTAGGMQTRAAAYTIYCPKCGKPAATVTHRDGTTTYMHFTRRGSVYHVWDGLVWQTKRTAY